MTNDNSVLHSLTVWNDTTTGTTAGIDSGTVTVGSVWWPDTVNPTVYYPAYYQNTTSRPWAEPCVEKAKGGWILHYHGEKEVFTRFDALTARMKKILGDESK
jgi:hypothetical protein